MGMILFAVGLLAAALGYHSVFLQLRQRHREAYSALGSPSFRKATPGKSVLIQRFVYSRGPELLEDAHLLRWVWFLRLVLPTYLLFGTLWLIDSAL